MVYNYKNKTMKRLSYAASNMHNKKKEKEKDIIRWYQMKMQFCIFYYIYNKNV